MKRLLSVLTALAMAAPVAAEAGYFDRIEMGTRGLALGSAYGAGVEDVSAAHWNPAGLALLDRSELLLTHGRPYFVGDLTANSAAVGARFAGGGVAFSWHRLGITDVVAENLIGLSFGRWVYRDDSRTLHAGATAKLALVGFADGASDLHDFGSQTKATADLGLLLEEGGKLRFAAVLRHIGEPEFDFVDGGAATPMRGGLELSAAYRWRPESTIHFGRTEIGGESAWSYAGEIWFYEVFAIRAGVHDEEFAGGFGVRGRVMEVDLGFLTHESLGNTYRASLHLRVPDREETR